MIHRFSIANFYSIRDEQVIDLAIPGTTPEMPRFRASHADPKVRLPTVVAFFGANASGKSNILRALTAAMSFASDSVDLAPDAPLSLFQPFRATGYWSAPSRIAIDFDAMWLGIADDSHLFRYEIEIGHGERVGHRVKREVLRVREGKRFRRIFERSSAGISCAPELGLRRNDTRLLAVRENASVISTLAKLNHPFFRAVSEDIARAQRNVFGRHRVNVTVPDALNYLRSREEYRRAFVDAMQRLDLGLVDMEIVEGPTGLSARFEHEGLDHPVWVLEESEGTQHFLAMFPSIFYTLEVGTPAVLDEFEMSLHPHILSEIIRWFHDPDLNPRHSQLIVAAHNTSIIDDLEKEELFIVDKASDGATRVVPASNIMGLRREPSLARKYLGGVLGGVPNIG